jgi:tRNA A-37 threonylcarbamoyl transferase component Bud32
VLKEDGAVGVYRAEMLGRAVVLKRWDLDSLPARFKTALHASRGHRHWRGAECLLGHGIPTATPYLLATRRGSGTNELWLVMEALRGRTLLGHLAASDLSVRQEHAMARAAGRMVAQVGLARLFNRDSKPSNLIVTGVETDAPEIAIIDCVAIRRAPSALPPGAWRMFASLVIEPMGCGVAPRRTIMMRALRGYFGEAMNQRHEMRSVGREDRRTALRLVWNAVSMMIQEHGDPQPRVNPLVAPSATHSSDMH